MGCGCGGNGSGGGCAGGAAKDVPLDIQQAGVQAFEPVVSEASEAEPEQEGSDVVTPEG